MRFDPIVRAHACLEQAAGTTGQSREMAIEVMQGLRASRLPLPSLRMQAGILACSGDLRCYEIAPRSCRSFMLWRVCLPHMRDS